MSYNPSDLGPWIRFQDHQNTQTQSRNEQRSSIKQTKSITTEKKINLNKPNLHILLPRVAVRRKQFTKVIPEKKRKNKPAKSEPKIKQLIKMNQVNMKLANNEFNRQKSFDFQARKSKTITFDPPLISFYNKKHPKASKGDKTLYGFLNLDMELQDRFNSETDHKKMSTIDLNTLYNEKGSQQQKVIEKQISSQLKKSYNKQFARKRSLLELIKFMKSSGETTTQTDRNNQMHKKDRYSSLSKYENRDMNYDFLNTSLNVDPKYIPYFQARKSHYSLLKK